MCDLEMAATLLSAVGSAGGVVSSVVAHNDAKRQAQSAEDAADAEQAKADNQLRKDRRAAAETATRSLSTPSVSGSGMFSSRSFFQ